MKFILVLLFLTGCAATWDLHPKPQVQLVAPTLMEDLHCKDRPQNCK
jgi:hypothetical protein